MAIAIAEAVADVATTTDGHSLATAAFTPTANRILVAVVNSKGSILTAPTFTDAETAWVLWRRDTFSTGAHGVYVYYRQVGASPTSITPTFDCTGDDYSACFISVHSINPSVFGAAVPFQQAAFAEATGVANPTCSFGVAKDTNNGYLAFVFSSINPPAGTAPSGWTETADQGVASPNAGIWAGYRAGGETDTAVTVTMASNNWGMLILEVLNDTSVSPGTGHIIISGYAPTITASNDTVVAPGTGHVVISGHAPTVSVVPRITIDPTTPLQRWRGAIGLTALDDLFPNDSSTLFVGHVNAAWTNNSHAHRENIFDNWESIGVRGIQFAMPNFTMHKPPSDSMAWFQQFEAGTIDYSEYISHKEELIFAADGSTMNFGHIDAMFTEIIKPYRDRLAAKGIDLLITTGGGKPCTYRGAYSSTIIGYTGGDVVLSSGTYYKCIQSHSNTTPHAPPNATYWEVSSLNEILIDETTNDGSRLGTFGVLCFTHIRDTFGVECVPDGYNLFNEPDFAPALLTPEAEWRWSHLTILNTANSMRTALDAAGFTGCKVTAPSMNSLTNAVTMWGEMKADNAALLVASVGNVSWHNYNGYNQTQRLLMGGIVTTDGVEGYMTEHAAAPNVPETGDHNEFMQDIIEAKASAWMHFGAVGEATVFKQGGNYIFVDNVTTPGTPTIALAGVSYYFRHHWRSAINGATRLTATASVTGISHLWALQNPDGTHVVSFRATAAATIAVAGLRADTYRIRYTLGDGHTLPTDIDNASIADVVLASGRSLYVTMPGAGAMEIVGQTPVSGAAPSIPASDFYNSHHLRRRKRTN